MMLVLCIESRRPGMSAAFFHSNVSRAREKSCKCCRMLNFLWTGVVGRFPSLFGWQFVLRGRLWLLLTVCQTFLLRSLWKRREVVLEQTVVQAWRDLCFRIDGTANLPLHGGSDAWLRMNWPSGQLSSLALWVDFPLCWWCAGELFNASWRFADPTQISDTRTALHLLRTQIFSLLGFLSFCCLEIHCISVNHLASHFSFQNSLWCIARTD